MYYTTPTDQPPYPGVKIRITDHGWPSPLYYDTFEAMVDTGASFTCVPEDKVPPKAKALTTTMTIKLADGSETDREFVIVRDAVLEVLDAHGRIVATFRRSKMHLLIIKDGLLGRDLLNDCLCTFDGPGLQFGIVKTSGP